MYLNLSIRVREVKGSIYKSDRQLKKVECKAGHNIMKWNSVSTVSGEHNLWVRRLYSFILVPYIGLSQCDHADSYITGRQSPLATRHSREPVRHYRHWQAAFLLTSVSALWFPHFSVIPLTRLGRGSKFLGEIQYGGAIFPGVLYMWDHITCNTESKARCLPSLEESQECRSSEGWPSFYLL